MTTLVTGATGFVGGNLARALTERDEDVRVLVRPASNDLAIRDLNVTQVTGDVLCAESLRKAVARLRDGLSLRCQLFVLVSSA